MKRFRRSLAVVPAVALLAGTPLMAAEEYGQANQAQTTSEATTRQQTTVRQGDVTTQQQTQMNREGATAEQRTRLDQQRWNQQGMQQAGHTQFQLTKATKLLGAEVYGEDNQKIGQLKELAFDPTHGHIAYGIVALDKADGAGDHIAVPWKAFDVQYHGQQAHQMGQQTRVGMETRVTQETRAGQETRATQETQVGRTAQTTGQTQTGQAGQMDQTPRLVLQATPQQLAQAPRFRAGDYPEMDQMDWAMQTHRTFGVMPYWQADHEEQIDVSAPATEMRQETELNRNTGTRQGTQLRQETEFNRGTGVRQDTQLRQESQLNRGTGTQSETQLRQETEVEHDADVEMDADADVDVDADMEPQSSLRQGQFEAQAQVGSEVEARAEGRTAMSGTQVRSEQQAQVQSRPSSRVAQERRASDSSLAQAETRQRAVIRRHGMGAPSNRQLEIGEIDTTVEPSQSSQYAASDRSERATSGRSAWQSSESSEVQVRQDQDFSHQLYAFDQQPADHQSLAIVHNDKLIGVELRNTKNDKLGKVHDLMVNTKNGQIAYAIVSLEEDRLVAVPWNALQVRDGGRHIVLDSDRERLEQLSFTGDQWPQMSEMAWHRQTHTAFGQDANWLVSGYFRASQTRDAQPMDHADLEGEWEPQSQMQDAESRLQQLRSDAIREQREQAGSLPSDREQIPTGSQTHMSQWQADSYWNAQSTYVRSYQADQAEEFQGRVISVSSFKPDARSTQDGVSLTIRTDDNQTRTVHLGPQAYLQSRNLQFRAGDELTFSAAPAQFQGQQVYIAGSVEKAGQQTELRNDQGQPLWLKSRTGQPQQDVDIQSRQETQIQGEQGTDVQMQQEVETDEEPL